MVAECLTVLVVDKVALQAILAFRWSVEPFTATLAVNLLDVTHALPRSDECR